MNEHIDILGKIIPIIKSSPIISPSGRIVSSVGTIIKVTGLKVGLGEVCLIDNGEEKGAIAEVIGFDGNKLIMMALEDFPGITPGALVYPIGHPLIAGVSSQIIGRVLDGLGRPIDGKGPISGGDMISLNNSPPDPLKRDRISEPFYTGIRAIDSLTTLGKGQRIGIFAGSGIGKSVLMGMIARNCYGDVNVIGLIGERGREVREFIEKDLGDEGLKRSVVVTVTSDKSPLLKIKGAFLCTAIAEYFRDMGNDVLLMMDSLTRVATAQREIGLAAGEPPTTRGYTPSAFTMIPKLLERAGASEKSSITGIYTVLVEGDDQEEPVADTARATLDGHIVLSRKLANRSHFPAIDITASISRVMPDIVDEPHLELSRQCKKTISIYNDSEDLINVGAYTKGSSKEIDYAIENIGKINDFLQQGIDEKSPPEESIARLSAIFSGSNIKEDEKETNETVAENAP